MTKETEKSNLYSKIAGLLQAAKQNVVRAVNQTMVYTYFEIGRMIVEDEQHGKERAEYGKQVLKELSKRLTAEFGKGFSQDNLERMKGFYLTYSGSISANMLRKSENNSISSNPLTKFQTVENDSISQTTSAELHLAENKESAISEMVSRKFILSWSHYLKLMRITNPDELSRPLREATRRKKPLALYCAKIKAKPWLNLLCPKTMTRFLPAGTKRFCPINKHLFNF